MPNREHLIKHKDSGWYVSRVNNGACDLNNSSVFSIHSKDIDYIDALYATIEHKNRFKIVYEVCN